MKVRVHISGQTAGAAKGGSLKGSFAVSLVLHSVIFGLALFGTVLVTPNRGAQWGEEGLGGQAVAVNLTPSIPMPNSPTRENPLASVTKEVNPAEVKPPARQETAPPSDRDFQLSEREMRKKMADLDRRLLQRELAAIRNPREVPENAIPGSTASGRASSAMYGMATSQGSGGMGFAGDFGALYGWYVRQVRDCISRHWDQSRIDTSARTAPKVYVEFDIQRDGVIRAERVATSSSIPTIDREAIRSVQACSGRREVGAESHLPALPSDYRGSSVHVEVWFEFKK